MSQTYGCDLRRSLLRLEGVRYKAAELADQDVLELKLERDMDNSWGATIFLPRLEKPFALRGAVPHEVLGSSGKRRAVVFFLESMAQVTAVALCCNMGLRRVTCSIDDEEARCLLTKSDGQNDSVNTRKRPLSHSVTRKHRRLVRKTAQRPGS